MLQQTEDVQFARVAEFIEQTQPAATSKFLLDTYKRIELMYRVVEPAFATDPPFLIRARAMHVQQQNVLHQMAALIKTLPLEFGALALVEDIGMKRKREQKQKRVKKEKKLDFNASPEQDSELYEVADEGHEIDFSKIHENESRNQRDMLL